VGFELPMKGSLPLVFILAILLGMSGMLAGLVISAVCEEEQAAMQLALGSFFPMLLLSGVIWPVEAIPMGIRYFR
jgi:ABC-type polysaccharide/polyol phosphate export permease